MSISFSLQKKEVNIMYHGIQKKIVTDEWLIKETKVKAQNKDYIYGYEYNGYVSRKHKPIITGTKRQRI